MTARWSGVFRGATAATPRLRGGPRSGTPLGFPGGARRAVSEEGVFAAGAREQTSVVEADSKHLGGASKESRKALRGANRQATGRQTARTGPAVILFAKGCNGSRRPKGRGEPSVAASCESLVVQSSLGGRSPGCRSGPWKARGVSTPVSAKHANRRARSRLRGEGTSAGDRRSAPWSDIARPRHCLFVGSPSRWAQGAGGRSIASG